MKKLLKEHWKEIFQVTLFIFVMSFVAIRVNGWLQSDMVHEKVESTGYWGVVILVLYVAASHVIAPLAGSPGMIVALSVYGLYKGWLITYLGSLLSATINFYIARMLGREWVIKLAGKRSINKIDRFIELMGVRLLIIARLFGFSVYEFISYAVGFTNMSFKKYFLITATASLLPGTLVTIWVYNSLDSPFAFSIFLATMILTGILFTWYIVWLYTKIERKRA